MASFREMFFTPAEFANIAKIDRSAISTLETEGLLKTTKRKMGNVDRKMIALEDMQNYFRATRGRHGDAQRVPRQLLMRPVSRGDRATVAASRQRSSAMHHKTQMFYNVKGGTGKSTLTAQYVMRAAMMGLDVLALDLDGQGHLTVNLDILDAHERPTIYDV